MADRAKLTEGRDRGLRARSRPDEDGRVALLPSRPMKLVTCAGRLLRSCASAHARGEANTAENSSAR